MENRAIEPDSALPRTFAILSRAIEEFRGNAPSLFYGTEELLGGQWYKNHKAIHQCHFPYRTR
tara:strand:+ start:503 stop:691 length:189 start_codon:yes stop_codon:yes gene_type:complete